MDRQDLFTRLALQLWESESIAQHNFNFDFEEFKRCFLRTCSNAFDGVILIKGDVIN